MKFFVVAFLCSFILNAQESFLTFENNLKQWNNNVRDSYMIKNHETGNMAVFLDDNITINGYLFNQEGELLKSYSSEGLDTWYDEIIGYTTSGNEFRLYYKSGNNKKFGSILFSFDASKSIETILPFKLKKDQFLQTQSRGDEFHIISSVKGKSILNIYTFSHNGSFSKKELKLPVERFETYNGSKVSLNKLLAVSSEDSKKLDVMKIDKLSPNSIEVASSLSKFYPTKTGFILTSDILRKNTIITEVNYEDFSLTLTELDKPKLQNEKISYVANSFIYDDHLFLISASKEEMAVEIRNRGTNEVIKEWSIQKGDSITFNNTPLIQKNNSLKNSEGKIINKTKAFLRKISSEKVGISAYKNDNTYRIIIGGTKSADGLKNAAQAVSFILGPFVGVSIGALSISFNPTYFAFLAYSRTKSTKFETLLDFDFNHLQGDISPNKFDEIREFSKNLENPKGESIFRFENSFLYGYYNPKTTIFSIHSF